MQNQETTAEALQVGQTHVVTPANCCQPVLPRPGVVTTFCRQPKQGQVWGHEEQPQQWGIQPGSGTVWGPVSRDSPQPCHCAVPALSQAKGWSSSVFWAAAASHHLTVLMSMVLGSDQVQQSEAEKQQTKTVSECSFLLS